MTSIAIGVLGLLAGVVTAWIIYWLCFAASNSSEAMSEEALEDIAKRARSIRENSEDVLMRVARIQELQRIRERVGDHKDDHKERGGG